MTYLIFFLLVVAVGPLVVTRYAWFTARATNVGTVPSLLNSAAGSLTQVGAFYNSKGDRLTP
jgi:hypothetical protein